MASRTTRIVMSSASKSALRVERKRKAYRQWLLTLIHGPTPGLPDNLITALSQPASHRVADHWLRVSSIDRDGPRNEGELPHRQLPPRCMLPPIC
jgi:hypothetical protein